MHFLRLADGCTIPLTCARIERLEKSHPIRVSSQVTTIANLRWRLFVNGLRSRRGKMELLSRVIVTLAFTVGGFGGFAAAMGFAWYFVSQNKSEFLPALLWPIFLFWQVFPVMATAFTNNPDSSELLRFPLTYRSFFRFASPTECLIRRARSARLPSLAFFSGSPRPGRFCFHGRCLCFSPSLCSIWS